MEKKRGRPTQREAPPFGQRLAALRNKQGLTQNELAQQLGMTQKAIDFYERRSEKPSIRLLIDLSKIFGVSTDELLGLKSTKNLPAKTGPTPLLDSAVHRLKKLPKSKQQTVLAMLEGLLDRETSKAQ